MLIVVLCAVVFACVLAMRAKSKSKAHVLPPAYPGALPLIGHSHLLIGDTAKLWLRVQDIARDAVKNGGVTYGVFGTEVYYLIADAEDALTASNACLQKHFAYDFGKAWLGEGLITSSGEIWKHHRKLLQPAFNLSIIYGFLDVFNDQARKLVGEVKPHIGKEPFIPIDYLRKTALATFCLGIFGIDAVEDKDLIHNYMNSIDIALDLITHRFQKIWLHNDLLYRLSGMKKKEQDTVDNINKMSNEIMQRKRLAVKNAAVNNDSNDLKTTAIKYKPVLDLLLQLSVDGCLTDKEIREEMDTMIAAGFETTSNQLMYTLLLLGSNPNALNKMFEEILEVVGPVRNVNKDDINKLVYTNAVIMESLRLIPSVPVLLRYVDRDVKLKNYTMRAGSQCVIFPLINRHDPTWGTSGDKFIPERWLEDSELCGKKEFAAFGLGKRVCLGRQYGMISMKVFLVHFIREYKVTADISRLKYKIDFVLKAIAGNEIRIDRRH